MQRRKRNHESTSVHGPNLEMAKLPKAFFVGTPLLELFLRLLLSRTNKREVKEAKAYGCEYVSVKN